jgi:hypothetical protein
VPVHKSAYFGLRNAKNLGQRAVGLNLPAILFYLMKNSSLRAVFGNTSANVCESWYFFYYYYYANCFRAMTNKLADTIDAHT